MRAMILAAGLGTRLLPYTKSLPKPLLPVNGKPLIAYPLGLVKEAGVKDVVVNVYHLADQIESALKACSTMGLNIRFARERNLLETGGGLSNAQGFLGN
ncbi:MAG TPA: sugar phosphate nucleotidyltransferase, partial [Candidatus Latescibacteria bacterium]|nr:sugar phosphate nucleotidyltransferase [Candidatus Latescibacterota bacterium]